MSRWDGMWLTSLGGNLNPSISGNLINGGFVDKSYNTSGYHLWHNTTTAPGGISIKDGTISGVDYGVWINNWEGYPTTTGSNAGSTTVSIDNIAIDGAKLAGVYIHDNPLNTKGTTAFVHANIQNSDMTNSAIGILVEGEDATVEAKSNTFLNNNIHIRQGLNAVIDLVDLLADNLYPDDLAAIVGDDIIDVQPDPGPGGGGGGDFGFEFDFPTLPSAPTTLSETTVPPEGPLTTTLQSLVIPPADPQTEVQPLITVQFVQEGTNEELADILATYEEMKAYFDENWESMSPEEYAQTYVDLTVAWAAILARQAALLAEQGSEFDLAAVNEAYNAALAALAEYGDQLSAEQLAAAEEVLAAVAELIAQLPVE